MVDELVSTSKSSGSQAVHCIRLALGLNYFHFGFLKFYPDLSPAEVLASFTAQRLSLYTLDSASVLFIIAVLECAIGLCLLFNVFLKWIAPIFFFHMAATFLPLFLLPEVTFKFAPLAPTIEGQYILKNLVFVSAGWLIFAPYWHRQAKTCEVKASLAYPSLQPESEIS